MSVVCKDNDNGKLLFIRRNIQYFVSTAMLNVAFKAKGNGRVHDRLSRYKWATDFAFVSASVGRSRTCQSYLRIGAFDTVISSGSYPPRLAVAICG